MPDPPTEQAPTLKPPARPDHHGSGVDHAAHETKPKKRRKLIRLFLALIVCVALLIGLAPMLLSTGPGTRWLVSMVNSSTPGQLTINDLQLSWFGGQRAEGIVYDDPSQGFELTIDSLDAKDLGLFDVLTGSQRVGEVWLTKVHAIYSKPADQPEATDPGLTAGSKAESEPFVMAPGFSGTLVIDSMVLEYHEEGIEPIKLTSKQDSIQITDIRDIAISYSGELKQGLETGRVELSGNLINFFDFDGAQQPEQASYHLDAKIDVRSVGTLDRVVSGFNLAIKPGKMTALLGQGRFYGEMIVNGTIDQLESKLLIETPKLELGLEQRTEDNTLIASPESYAKLDLDQDAFLALSPDSGLKLLESTQVDLTSLEMSLPVLDRAVDWDNATAALVLKAADNLAVVDQRGEVLGINDLRVTGRSDSIAQKLSFNLSTELTAVDENAQVTRDRITVELDVIKPMEATREIAFFSEKLPIGLVDALVGKGWELPLWLGETLDLDADLRGVQSDGEQVVQSFALRPDGRLTGTVNGSFTQGSYRISTPANEPVEAVLTPEAFASLMGMLSGKPDEPALTIDRDMPVFVTLGDSERGAVSLVTRQDKQGVKRFYPDPDRTYLGATIELSPARVYDPRLKKTYELRGGLLMFRAPDLRGKTDIRAELDLWVRPDAGKEGVASLLTWNTTVTDLLDSEGSVPLDGAALIQQLAVDGTMRLDNVPSGLVDTLLSREGDLASILGPIVQEMDAGFTYKDGQPTGATVRLNWDEKNNQPIPDAWASMKPAAFDIDKDQMLTVRGGEDLELEVRVNEAFGDRWMGQLHPILFDAKSGDRPVKVKIDGSTFRFPLKGDKMLGSRVEATVDLGTINFGDDALLGKLLNWTDRPGERAVFEPAIVKLVDGKISYDELDLAVGKVKLRLDGEVDLASGQIVDMAVRVPGDSLIRVFNELDGVIAKDDYLSIPMSGEIRRPEFDSSLLGLEVARLITRGVIEREKDKLGDTLGDLIKKGLGDKDKPRPDQENPPKDNGQQPEQQDEQADREKEVADELIERGLDMLFKRLGKDKDKPKQE